MFYCCILWITRKWQGLQTWENMKEIATNKRKVCQKKDGWISTETDQQLIQKVKKTKQNYCNSYGERKWKIILAWDHKKSVKQQKSKKWKCKPCGNISVNFITLWESEKNVQENNNLWKAQFGYIFSIWNCAARVLCVHFCSIDACLYLKSYFSAYIMKSHCSSDNLQRVYPIISKTIKPT